MADGAVVRTVGELMSSPVVTAEPAETVADASARMRDAGVGSVVVVDSTQRAVGILTERDLVRFAAAGDAARATKVSEWMTEDPATVGPDVPVGEAFAVALRARLPPHPGGRRRQSVVGIVSLRDLLKIAAIEPVTHPGHMEAPKGLAGVIVAETVDRRRPGPGGLLPLPPVLGDGPGREALAGGRLAPDVRGRAAHGGPAGGLRSPRSGPTAVLPDTVAPQLPAIADDRRALPAARRPAHGRSRWSARRSTSSPSLDIDRRGAAPQTPCRSAPSCPRRWPRSTGCTTATQPIDPHPDLGYAANYLYMITGEVPDPELARGIEQYLITTVDHGFNASTFTARVITSTGADLAAAVVGRHRRAVRPAARRRAQPGAGHARRDRHARQDRRLGPRRGRARRPDHGLRPPRLQDRRPPLAACCGRGRAPRRARWPTSPRRSSRPSSTSWPS